MFIVALRDVAASRLAQTGPQDFVRRPIETATNGSGRLRVMNGVNAGDRVVSDGVLLLRQLEADSPAQ